MVSTVMLVGLLFYTLIGGVGYAMFGSRVCADISESYYRDPLMAVPPPSHTSPGYVSATS